MVFARPREALAAARRLLESGPPAAEASIAHQVIGIWERDFGDLASGLRHLRRARRLAALSGSPDRQADVLATLGAAYIRAGRVRQSLAALARAVALAEAAAPSGGRTLPRILFRRAYVLEVLGRHREALEDLRRAVPLLRRNADTIWLARAVSIRARVHLALGSVDRARGDVQLAETLFGTTGQEHDKAVAVLSQGIVASRSGDVPAALALFDRAERRFAEFGTPSHEAAVERGRILLVAGLAAEALKEARAAIERLDRLGGPPLLRAELLLVAARAALACGRWEAAIDRARAAARSFRAQHRQAQELAACLIALQARHRAGQVPGGAGESAGGDAGEGEVSLREAVGVARRLSELAPAEAPRAWLLAGRVAATRGRPAEAARYLAEAARARTRGPAYARVDGWLARAMLAETAGRRAGVLAACRRGLDLLDEHRMTLGAAELRARVGSQGAELATLAQRAVLDDARRLLAWSERWRATALAVPPVRPPQDPELLRDLTAFREISSRIDEARAEGTAAPALEREQRRLERAIRNRMLALRGRGETAALSDPAARFDPAALLRELGDRLLAEIVVVDGRLKVLLCGRGRVRAFDAGTAARAAAEAEHAASLLRRTAYGRAGGRLEEGALRLQEALLGAAVPHLGDGPLVLVPPGRLHHVPWALLPALRERALSVCPSAAAWLRARRIRPPGGPVVLVRGPGLGSGGAEVPILARLYGTATVLEGEQAATAPVLKHMDGSALTHIAAHGAFRADSPMFSSLQLHDGPLTVHDVERLERAPYRLVLAGCDSGRMEPVGGEELLGLAAALLPRGTAGIVASTAPVPDRAVVPLMTALHEGLGRGLDTAEALLKARAALPPDPLHQAAGWAFCAIGAA